MTRYFLALRDELQMRQSALTTIRREWVSFPRRNIEDIVKARSVIVCHDIGATTGLPYDDDVIRDFLGSGAFVELTEASAKAYQDSCRDWRKAGLIFGLLGPALVVGIFSAMSRWLEIESRLTQPGTLVFMGILFAIGMWAVFQGPRMVFRWYLPVHTEASPPAET